MRFPPQPEVGGSPIRAGERPSTSPFLIVTATESGSNIGGSLPGVTLTDLDPHVQLLQGCFLAGVDAVRPDRCLPRFLERIPATSGPTALLAVGKAAGGMSRAIASSLAERGMPPGQSLVIGLGEGPGMIAGDHPVPGGRSARAALAIERWVGSLPANAEVHVAISGGTTSLIAAPLPGLAGTDLQQVFAILLASGLDVSAMNALRKRLTRWGAGRLAAALAPRRTFAWVISDVPGDDPATVGSGPCSGDAWHADALRSQLESTGVWQQLSPAVRAAIAVETVKPGAPELAGVHLEIVGRNRDAMSAAAAYATTRGCLVHDSPRPLTGEARLAGERIAAELLARQERMSNPIEVTVYGGETVVTLPDAFGVGGRNQELALAAARIFDEARCDGNTMLLAAGTDGKDGSSPAAGATVDGNSWRRIAGSGHDPRELLERHQSHRALEAAGVQLITGATGTNVMDLAIGLNVERVRLGNSEAHP